MDRLTSANRSFITTVLQPFHNESVTLQSLITVTEGSGSSYTDNPFLSSSSAPINQQHARIPISDPATMSDTTVTSSDVSGIENNVSSSYLYGDTFEYTFHQNSEQSQEDVMAGGETEVEYTQDFTTPDYKTNYSTDWSEYLGLRDSSNERTDWSEYLGLHHNSSVLASSDNTAFNETILDFDSDYSENVENLLLSNQTEWAKNELLTNTNPTVSDLVNSTPNVSTTIQSLIPQLNQTVKSAQFTDGPSNVTNSSLPFSTSLPNSSPFFTSSLPNSTFSNLFSHSNSSSLPISSQAPNSSLSNITSFQFTSVLSNSSVSFPSSHSPITNTSLSHVTSTNRSYPNTSYDLSFYGDFTFAGDLFQNDVTTTSGQNADSWDIYVKVCVLALISLVASFGNVILIWSIVKSRHLHRPPFYVVLSFAVTDFSRAVFCVPVVITTVLHGSQWRHGDAACKLFAFATSFFVFSSALSLLTIAIDRHVSIVYSKTYRRHSHGLVNLIVVIVVWVLSFCISFPPVLGVGGYIFIPGEAQCFFHHKHVSHNDPAVASVFVFLIMLFLAYFLYYRIFKFLRAHRKMRPLQHQPARSATWAFVGQGANGQAFINWLNGFGGQVPVRQAGQRQVQRLNFGRVVNLSTAKNEHLTRLFLILTLVFGVTWSPYIVLSFLRIFGDSNSIPSGFEMVAAWLGYGQCAICPVVYFMVKHKGGRLDRTVYSPAEKKEFLLENKIRK